ncbi:MAG: hypothetical protein CMH70_02335 [Nitrosomonadaceae bacterium]|nr:hypothetical protein [Nitrosomonadaceae bacterium]|tara:strand:- start:496 stop:846 length:351 start_codon:yes stop_codon:yes gene_type:complete
MKFSLFTAALVVFTLTACGKPHQANPESIEGYGTRTEEGTTVEEERAAAGENTGIADPSSFDVKNSGQGENHATDAELAGEDPEDEYSGKAVLPSHNLDGNGNPITDGKDPTKLNH